jgi:hypothetical protein
VKLRTNANSAGGLLMGAGHPARNNDRADAKTRAHWEYLEMLIFITQTVGAEVHLEKSRMGLLEILIFEYTFRFCRRFFLTVGCF